MSSPIFSLADDYVESYAQLHPIDALERGLRTTIDDLDDLSPDGHEARAELNRATLATLGRLAPGTDDERVAAVYMRGDLASGLALAEAGEHLSLRPLRTWGPVGRVRQAFDHMPNETPEDWERIGALLHRVPVALGGLTQTLRAGLAAGVVAPRRSAAAALQYAENWSSMSPGGFFVDLVSAAPMDLSTAAGAYGALATFLSEVYLPRTHEGDGCGPDEYALWARSHLGGALDVAESYAWAWEELNRIEDERRTVAGQVEPGADFGRAQEIFAQDRGGWIEGPEAYRDWLQALADSTVEQLDGTQFDIDPRVRHLDIMVSPPGSSAGTYYSPPSEDFSRPGRTWFAIANQTRFRPQSGISTAYHEGVPGHHLQNGAVRVNAEALSRYQRVFYLNFHGEGWALYAEELMGELGYLDAPEARLSMLYAQAHRAARVILDIGLHHHLTVPSTETFYPEEAWSYELAVEFLTQLGMSARASENEVRRYLGAPGQAITYKLGQQAWLRARATARQRMGPAFDLKAFHSAALALGPLGVDDLEREVAHALNIDQHGA